MLRIMTEEWCVPMTAFVSFAQQGNWEIHFFRTKISITLCTFTELLRSLCRYLKASSHAHVCHDFLSLNVHDWSQMHPLASLESFGLIWPITYSEPIRNMIKTRCLPFNTSWRRDMHNNFTINHGGGWADGIVQPSPFCLGDLRVHSFTFHVIKFIHSHMKVTLCFLL